RPPGGLNTKKPHGRKGGLRFFADRSLASGSKAAVPTEFPQRLRKGLRCDGAIAKLTGSGGDSQERRASGNARAMGNAAPRQGDLFAPDTWSDRPRQVGANGNAHVEPDRMPLAEAAIGQGPSAAALLLTAAVTALREQRAKRALALLKR